MAETPEKVPSLGVFSGMEAFGRGISFIVGSPRLWGYALVPVAMLCLVTFVVSGLLIWGACWTGSAIFGETTGVWASIGYWILVVLLIIISVLLAVIIGLSIAQPLSCFALERICHAHELDLTGEPRTKTSYLVSMWSTAKAVTLALMLGVPLLVILVAVGLFFPPATIVTVPLKFLICAWMLAWDFIDYPMGMRGLGLRARLKWVFKNFGAFTMFGVAWCALVIVPGVVLLILPMGVAGATYLIVEYERLQLENQVIDVKPLEQDAEKVTGEV